MLQNNYLPWLLLLFAYLLGSVPIGWIFGRVIYGKDIRKGGSGNIGATNALRMFGTTTGIIVLLLDMGKGFLATWLAIRFLPQGSPFVALAALIVILGHVFPVFLGFKGGKGVATAGGAFLALAPVSLVVALLVFIVLVVIFRYVSLGSICGAIAFLAHSLWRLYKTNTSDYASLVLITLVVLMIILKHQANLQRLLQGTENKLKFSKKGS